MSDATERRREERRITLEHRIARNYRMRSNNRYKQGTCKVIPYETIRGKYAIKFLYLKFSFQENPVRQFEASFSRLGKKFYSTFSTYFHA